MSRIRKPMLGITLLYMQKARSEACAPSLRQSRSGCVSGPTENLQYSRSLHPWFSGLALGRESIHLVAEPEDCTVDLVEE